MDPYKTPESNLELTKIDTPNSILMGYYFIGLSFLIFMVEELFYAANSDTGIFDPYHYIFIPIWAVILSWVTNSIRSRNENPKYAFLVLAFIVFGMSIYDPLGDYSIYTGLGEASCFLIVFYMLNRKPSKEWFK